VAGHPRPHPHRTRTPLEPHIGPLWPPTPREVPAGPLRPPSPGKPPPTPLSPSAAAPHQLKPQERPSIAVKRPKFPANKNNDKIYQMSSKLIINEDV
jgi:hypothetical protein